MIAFAPHDLRCDVTYSICLLCIGMFFNGAISSGHFSSFVDLAPNFAGTLFGISNVFSGGEGSVINDVTQKGGGLRHFVGIRPRVYKCFSIVTCIKQL